MLCSHDSAAADGLLRSHDSAAAEGLLRSHDSAAAEGLLRSVVTAADGLLRSHVSVYYDCFFSVAPLLYPLDFFSLLLLKGTAN